MLTWHARCNSSGAATVLPAASKHTVWRHDAPTFDAPSRTLDLTRHATPARMKLPVYPPAATQIKETPMFGQPSIRQYADARFAAKFVSHSPLAPHAPTENHILAALPPEEYERLLPDLEPVPLRPDWIVHAADEPENYLY